MRENNKWLGKNIRAKEKNGRQMCLLIGGKVKTKIEAYVILLSLGIGIPERRVGAVDERLKVKLKTSLDSPKS